MYKDQMFITRVGVATLNQWAMDFDLNKKNIIQSIKIAKEKGCTYRVGPELEICGYSCEDHFLENDTVQHCWEVLYEILQTDLTCDIIVDLGMPVIHKSVIYNCRIICFNQEIVLIRPKMSLADDGNYREGRYFTPWVRDKLDSFQLPELLWQIKGQRIVPIGVAIIKTLDTEIGLEICEELWVPQPISSLQALDGAEIIVNSSSSYFELRKMHFRTDLIVDITRRNGAVYLFSNMKGCDGNRVYFDGLSLIACNGVIFKTSEVFSLKDVEVITCDVDLALVRNHRINLKARSHQAAKCNQFERVHINFKMTQIQFLKEEIKPPIPQQPYFTEEQQMAKSIACYLWDYLRRSGASGYFLPLSGGADSAASACGIFHMCVAIYEAIQIKDEYGSNESILYDLRKIVGDKDFTPMNVEDIMARVFFTAYLGSSNSSLGTRQRAHELTQRLGNQHYEVEIDDIVKSFRESIKPIFKKQPQYVSQGGQLVEDLSLQNIQARTRMVVSYLIAQLAPWNEGKQGFLLVVGSANLDEGLRGYFTKYDCSSADVNPIGSLTKNDLRKFLRYTMEYHQIESLKPIIEAAASAELIPSINDQSHAQNSESDMGLTFDELETLGKLRKIQRLGPFGMFRRLLSIWNHLKPAQISELVKTFFKFYAINRHKVVILTPSFHAEPHSQDDNRFDLRQFLYNWRWPFQFRKIDELLLTQQEKISK